MSAVLMNRTQMQHGAVLGCCDATATLRQLNRRAWMQVVAHEPGCPALVGANRAERRAARKRGAK